LRVASRTLVFGSKRHIGEFISAQRRTRQFNARRSKPIIARAGEIATCVERESPGIIDKMGEFYAKHSALIKTPGGTAVTIALVRIAQSGTR
jgi:hypothetical protein